MNLGDSAIVLRPRTLSEVFDLACRLCCSLAFRLYTRLGLVVLLPILAICLALRHAADFPWWAVWLVAVALEPFAEGVFTVAASRVIFAPKIAPREVLGLFSKRLGPFFGVLVIRLLSIGVSSITLFLLLPFIAMRLLFLDEACLLEGLGGGRTLERSQALVSNRNGDALLAATLLLAARVGLVLASELLFQGLVDDVLQLGKPFGALFEDGGSPAALAGFLLSAPFAATARFLQYIDTRTRADGWDVQLRFTAIRAREGEAKKRAA
ncbi:hypothetical protein [Polyangium aurulentum]|uniref:hypothetical protein n=1 Tax=Polyangium aurulentum TaxID=2567896 RepID=UPI0010AE771C|nr:hypothetical protein [Polyangium aurulentum]UQA59576.1 hypothetical protein E8A73_003440 [Polyangium aurulentum]